MASVAPPIPAPAVPPVLPDVAGLIHVSRPQPIVRSVGRFVLAVWGVAILGPLIGLNPAALETIALLSTVAASCFILLQGAALRRETAAIEELEVMLAQRRAEEAAPPLHGLMSRPMRTPDNRLRAMLLLGGVLSRLNRSDDALAVYTELIDTEGLAGPGGAMVKIARATEMLRADHLYDADCAIADVKRLLERGGVAAEMKRIDADAQNRPDPGAMAGLRLLEIYRDVKTGHLEEAVAMFDANRPMLTAGLGHRVAGAYALVAVALHQLNRREEAADRYAAATALAPLSDLVRRYPELGKLVGVYVATVPPQINQ